MKSLIFRLSQYLPELMSIRNKTADPMNVIKMLSGHNANAGCWVTIHNYRVFPAAAGGVNIWYKLPTTRQAGLLTTYNIQPRLSRRIEAGWHTGGPPAPPWRWTWGRAGAWPRWGPWRPAWSGPSTAPRWCRSLPHNIHPCTHCRYRAVKVSTNCWL